MARIFLSHSVENSAEAVALRDWLVAQGWDDLFLDLDPERGLKAGERWQAALKRAAERCELVIFLISPAWAASKWCVTEFLLAKSLNKRIFGAIVRPTPLSDLPVELTSEWQVVDLTAGGRDHQMTVRVPPNDTPVTVAFGSDGLNRLRIGLMQAGLDPRYFAWPPESDPNRPPYRGLRPLEAEDAGIFFGRDGPIVLGLDLLRGLREAPPPRLLVILGASGAGKSSFMRAGLWPRLARESEHFLPLPVLRPERAALSGEAGFVAMLEQALREAGAARTRADIRAAVSGGASRVKPLLSSLVESKSRILGLDRAHGKHPPTLVLPIDQAEELFLAEGAEEAHAFLTLLGELTVDDTAPVIALFTIRSDGYERLQTAKELEGLRQHTLSLPPMPQGAYADVIKGPARRLEGSKRPLRIEDTLVDALLADIESGGAKDALPLLAFTLERLYREHGGDGDLRLAEYEELGRVKGSIEAAVERAFKAADADPKIPRDREVRLALLRRGLIPWLAGIDPDTGAPRRRVARLSEIPEEARPLIDHLVEQRLLATDVARDTGEKTIEPAHEALLRQWGLLQGWLAQDTALLSVLDGIKRAARDWAANGKGVAWLTHTGERLLSAEKLRERPDLSGNLEPTDWEYLAACHDAERAARGRTRRAKALVGALGLLLIAAGAGWWKQEFLKKQYHWRFVMKPSVLTAAEEKEKAASPGPDSAFAECANGCPTMVVVPAGKFMMGTAGELAGDEGPQHEVTIPRPFAVSRTEITFAQWDACVAGAGCVKLSDNTWGRDDRPAILISWDEAKQYSAWLSKLTGKEYRLLTESEWEYAARAGNPGKWSFGDKAKGIGDYAWYSGNSDNKTQPVGKRKPNAFGLYDMHGNVWEWVEDCWNESYADKPDVLKQTGRVWTAGDCSRRVFRGGSWYADAVDVRSALRYGTDSANRINNLGFRIARTLGP